MTETTQERVKNARKRLDIAEKWELPTITFFAIVELADEVKKLSDMNASLGTMINDKVAEIDKLETKLAELKEKMRWRKQSEEPAPNDDTLIICLLKKGGRCSWQAVIQARFIKQFEEPENNIFFWRPLDLPEMEGKEE